MGLDLMMSVHLMTEYSNRSCSQGHKLTPGKTHQFLECKDDLQLTNTEQRCILIWHMALKDIGKTQWKPSLSVAVYAMCSAIRSAGEDWAAKIGPSQILKCAYRELFLHERKTQAGTLYKPQSSTKSVFCKRTLSINKSHINEPANLDNASVVHSSSATHIKVGHHVCTNNSILSNRAVMRSGQMPELESPCHACTVWPIQFCVTGG